MKVTIPLYIEKIENNGIHLLVKARFDNLTKGYVIIDTGASSTVFDKKAAEGFAIPLHYLQDVKSAGINGNRMKALPVEFIDMWLGRYKFTVDFAVLITLKSINRIYNSMSGKTILGLLGGDFLVEHYAIIDYEKKRVTLRTKNE